MKPKTDKNVTLQDHSKPSNTRSHALLQFTLRKGISLYQFVVDNNVLERKKTKTEREREGSLPLTYSFVFGPEIEDGGDEESGEERQPETNNPPTSWRLRAEFTTVPTLIRPRQQTKRRSRWWLKVSLKKRPPKHDGLTATISRNLLQSLGIIARLPPSILQLSLSLSLSLFSKR
ncbi:hypothetical protein YC2023_088377 [Brassica napus]